jgi:hypothetical protein
VAVVVGVEVAVVVGVEVAAEVGVELEVGVVALEESSACKEFKFFA